MKLDAIRMLEAAYAPAPNEADWLSGVVQAATRSHALAFAYTFETHPRRGVRFGPMVDSGSVHPNWREEVVAAVRSTSPAVVDAYFRGGHSFDFALRSEKAHLRGWITQIVRSTLVADVLFAACCDPTGSGVAFGFPFTTVRPIGAHLKQSLAYVAAHLNAARRLRTAVQGRWSEASEAARVECVLDPNGRVLDAERAAEPVETRTCLSEATRARERARVEKLDARTALGLWQALVAGRWSLVDQEERGGRRLVLARRNTPNVREPRALARAERLVAAFAAMGHSNKFIAYELGMPPSSVSERLKSALAKLGLSSRQELIALLAPTTPSRPARRKRGSKGR